MRSSSAGCDSHIELPPLLKEALDGRAAPGQRSHIGDRRWGDRSLLPSAVSAAVANSMVSEEQQKPNYYMQKNMAFQKDTRHQSHGRGLGLLASCLGGPSGRRPRAGRGGHSF